MNGTLNKVTLIGHLGDNVKMHYFENGNCIGRFPLATNEVYVNKTSGEKYTSTEWHNIVVKNKAAEVCERYLTKGDRIYVEGRIRTRQWQGEDLPEIHHLHSLLSLDVVQLVFHLLIRQNLLYQNST